MGKNMVEKDQYFLMNFLSGKSLLNKPIKKDILYRIIVLDRENKSTRWKYEAKVNIFLV